MCNQESTCGRTSDSLHMYNYISTRLFLKHFIFCRILPSVADPVPFLPDPGDPKRPNPDPTQICLFVKKKKTHFNSIFVLNLNIQRHSIADDVLKQYFILNNLITQIFCGQRIRIRFFNRIRVTQKNGSATLIPPSFFLLCVHCPVRPVGPV